MVTPLSPVALAELHQDMGRLGGALASAPCADPARAASVPGIPLPVVVFNGLAATLHAVSTAVPDSSNQLRDR